MTLPVWPVGVPYQVRRDDWRPSESFLAPIETQFEGGNQRARRRPGDDVGVVDQTLRMTAAEAETLFDFIRDDLSNGTQAFTMSVWTGTAYETRTVEFTGKRPVRQPAGLKTAVQMTLRVWGGL
jgi:hypothetical protein